MEEFEKQHSYQRLPKVDSTIYGVSVRGWLAVVLVLTVCLLSGFKIEIKEPLYTLSSLAVGFYFGQKNHNKQ